MTMKYFQNITDLEQAKKHYRRLAMQLHPDKGGSAIEFQRMKQEYKALLVGLQNSQNSTNNQTTKQTDLMDELGKLAKLMIEKQIPQKFLKQRIKGCQSPIEKTIYSGIISFLEKL